MGDEKFSVLLDEFAAKKKSVRELCDEYNKQEESPTVTDQQLNEHAFFQNQLIDELSAVLDFWISDGTLSDDQKELFSSSSQFIWKLLNAASNASSWFEKQEKLIKLTEKCLTEIGAYGYYIGIGGAEDPSLESFDWLVRSFELIRCEKLLDELVKCVTSRFYVDALYKLSDSNGATLSITQHFLLVTCPNYILEFEKSKKSSEKIVEKMLGTYGEIFAHFLPHIKDWTSPVILCLSYPIKFLLRSTKAIDMKNKQSIYETISTILQNKDEIDTDNEKGRNALLFNTLCLLLEILRTDKKLLQQVKNEKEKNEKLIQSLKELSRKELNNRIRTKALETVSILVPEEELLNSETPEEVAGFYIKNLSEALQDGKTERADEVLTSLREMVQNDQVKQELVKQDGLPTITKVAKQTTENPLPLEITYAMTFNSDAKKFFNEDKDFVEHIRSLKSSEKNEVSRIAQGIMWKLEGEEKFKNQERKVKAPEQTNNQTENDEDKPKYDMMISYCWAQQPLCHKINDRLEKDGFSVWLDRDEMHGSIVEAMAEAIESSRFVLLCMSSNYKKSTNCKAEAEYAFNRKSKIIPLIVEAGYKADGWLGFLAGSNIYVDFADKEDEEFEKAYALLIAELERNGLNDKNGSSTNSQRVPNEKKETKSETKEEAKKEEEITSKEYLTVGPVTSWSEKNVLEFLNDQKLKKLVPICDSMDGPTLMEFHSACQTSPEKIFPLINPKKDEHSVSIADFFNFITKLKKFFPPPVPRKIQFQYNFLYPTTTNKTENDKK